MSRAGDLEPSDGLDDGLRAAFGGPPVSVIARLEGRVGSALRVTLPDTGDDAREPVVKPAGSGGAPDMGPRYQVLGEIARGGLGVVTKARDLDLGRDVAVKVLHDRFKDDRRVIERFVEEAQIGGQLQHPGIVPVYELGLRADERPFFAMKLVKGETLAAMLHKRRGPADGEQRFLRVFLQICQTLAYAHARRVVHRDLKPSNVLVGAFGEVQVVDWGLAKVLRAGGVADERTSERGELSVIETIRSAEGSSPSLAGSVLGTPAYMPPEQAVGDVGRIDARTDVFALGAVLCEILTGRPPYDAEDPATAVREAAECRQDRALERLASCAAAPDLVALTRACLAPAPDARPLDAGEVARRIEEHLQSTEERARRAEVRAAELRVRTRSFITLAAVILAVLVVAAGTFVTWDARRRERRAETAERANAAVAEATRYVGQAQQAGLGGIGLWQLALGAARRAEEIVAAGDADAGLEAQVAALVRDVEESEERTRAAALEEESHAALLAQVLEVRVGPDVPRIDVFQGPARRERESTRRAAEYARLFATVGLEDGSPVERVAERFDCAHRVDVALALDAWAEARRVAALFAEDPDPETWRRLVRAARRLDPEDPWRNALRDELGREELDPQALRSLATPVVLRERRADEVALVVALLDAAGDVQAALDAQLEGMLAHPTDYWLNVSFQNLCAQEELTGRLYDDAAGWGTRAAVVLRPHSRAARFQFAMTLFDETGEEHLRELLRETPDDLLLQSSHFMMLMNRGRFQEAVALLPDALPALRESGLDRDYAPFLWGLGYGEAPSEGAAPPTVRDGLELVRLGRYEAAWDILSERRDELGRSWPWLYLPPALREVASAAELRSRVEGLKALEEADDATLRATPVDDLLAATDLCAPVACVRLFRHAFDKDPASEDVGGLARARQIAAFTAAAASGGTAVGPGPTAEVRAELRSLALGWLDEELDVIERDLTSIDLTRERATHYSRNFHQMTVYGYLAPIREEAFLEEMSPEQAHACRLLWARVAGLEATLVALTSKSS